MLIPTSQEIWAVVSLLAFYLAADDFFGSSSYLVVNTLGPLALTAILCYGGWLMVRSDGKNLWTALFWFRLSTAVYFGVGTIFVYIANDMTRLYMESFFRFSDEDVFKLNLIVTLSVILVLIMARITILAIKKSARRHRTKAIVTKGGTEKGLFSAAVVFLAIGLTINYMFAIPYRMGWTSTTLPGSVMNLTKLIPVGVFFITLWGLRNARWLLPAIFGLVAVEMLFSLLMFMKGTMLLLLIMMSLAFLWDQVTLKKLLITGTIVLVAYFASKPIVDHARHEIELRYGANTQAGFGERLEIISEYFTAGQTAQTGEEVQSELSRLSYVNAATFIIHLYDSGQPSNWPKLIPAVFVPRFLWPEKPIITAIGMNIYELGTGNRGSSSGAGIFAETYWAMGWWGVIFFMSVYGVIIGVLTRFALGVMHDGRWLYFPVVLMALRYGMRTDGHYISDVAGALVILVALYILIRILDVFIKSFLKPLRF